MTPTWPTAADCAAAFADGSGEGITVAVLDTGVDPSHEMFSGCDFAGFHEMRISPAGPVCVACQPGDPVGHGTAIAGLILRLAPRARILSIRVLDAASRQQRHEIIRAGAIAAMDRGCHLLNASFGVPATLFSLPTHLEWADAAFLRGVTVLAAASNLDPDHPEWPAHFATVLGVSAADCRAEACAWRTHRPVPLAASGVNLEVPVPGGGFTTVSGSSFATAHATGLAARLLSRFPHASPAIVREAFNYQARQQ
jgi:subtilisin family serine protease